MKKIRRITDKILASMVAGLMALLVVVVVWQVFSRYVLKDPSSYTDELSRFLLMWVALLGAAYAAGKKLHLAIDLARSRFNPLWLDRFIYGLIALFSFVVLVIGGWRLASLTLALNQTSAALQIPLGYVYMVLPLTGLLMILYSVLEIIHPETGNR